MKRPGNPPPEALAAAERFAAGDLAQAFQLAQASLTKGACPEAFAIIAAVHHAQGRTRQADASYRKGLERFPNDPGLCVHYAKFLREIRGRAPEAVALLSAAIKQAPDFAAARLSLVETYRTVLARFDLAEAAAREFIARFPNDAGGHLALALTLFNAGKLQAAREAADRCLALGGNAARAWELKANLCVALGDAPAALACYRSLLAVALDADIHSRILMTMQYCEDVTEDQIYAETRAWVAHNTKGVVARTAWKTALDPAKTLTVGVMSRDFRQSSTLYLARPLFENFPPEWRVVFYANVEYADAETEMFRGFCDAWVDIGTLSDDAAAARIATDGIDILIDLNGHTLGGRPGVLARRPAPVQVAWLDYVGTTGLGTMDAIIADAGHVLMIEQPRYSEPIRHVADDLYRYAPPADAPLVAPPPAAKNGFVTFGCFNSAYKLSLGTIARWSEILQALPSARLILNSREFAYEDTRARFLGLFAARGIETTRLDLRPGADNPQGMLDAYADVDIALDPAPYSGGLTTLEALYMGVPVVTSPGGRFGSRHSAVHLAAVGLKDWIAPTMGDYVALAIAKTGDTAKLARLRKELRGRLERSPLMDGAALAKDFTKILATLWREACASTQTGAP